MTIYQCWFQSDAEEDGKQIISDDSLEEVAEKFAQRIYYERNMWEYLNEDGEDYWDNGYAICIRRKGDNKTRTFNIKIWMSPNFRAELVK